MCEFLTNNEQCGKIKKYGDFCCKHKRNYLVKEDFIVIKRFTGNPSDYLKADLVRSLKKISKENITIKEKKDYYFDLYSKNIQSLTKYSVSDVIKVQSIFRKKNLLRNVHLRGKGFLNRKLCHNTEDFFTYENSENIDRDYFISYTDNNNLTWCFDIRSFNKLFEYKQENPYTREIFPDNFIKSSEEITIQLKNKNKVLTYDSQINAERKNNIKQITVDLFSDIEIAGYDCNIKWFLDLHIKKLKFLYRTLEDIWNWRAKLKQEVKNDLVPPNGRIFTTPVHHVDRMRDRREVQELIINEVSKFKTAVTHGDKVTGFMYFLMGLGHVSPQCYSTYPWELTG